MTVTELPPNLSIRHDLKPGDIGYLIHLHGVLYAREQGWNPTFEAYVAGTLAEFAKSHSDRERIWIVEKDGQVAGAIAIVSASREEAQLRWFLLDPELRGQGIGRILINEALAFCRNSGYSSVFLRTVTALTAAAGLYQAVGFRVTEETTQAQWGATVTEQRYDLRLC